MQDLIELEKQGWKALSTSKDAATEFYESLLIDEAIMVFPGGMMLVGKNQILESVNAQPWKSFEIADSRELSLSEDARALVYRATAQRPDSEPYKALVSSTYILCEEQWRLALHQQTLV